LPPARKPPEPPIENGFSPQPSPMPIRKLHKQPIPDINFIESTPSPVLKGNQHHHGSEDSNNNSLIEIGRESEIKIDELNNRASNSNVRKEGIIADRVRHDDELELDIKVYPKGRTWVDDLFFIPIAVHRTENYAEKFPNEIENVGCDNLITGRKRW